jgi:hypothetical protein
MFPGDTAKNGAETTMAASFFFANPAVLAAGEQAQDESRERFA